MANDLSLSRIYTAPVGHVDLSLSYGEGGTDLHLQGAYTPPVGLVDLELGGGGPSEGIIGVLAGQLAGLVGSFIGCVGVTGSIYGALALSATFTGNYDPNVWRGLTHAAGAAYATVPQRGCGDTRIPYNNTLRQPIRNSTAWGAAGRLDREVSAPMVNLPHLRIEQAAVWGAGIPIAAAVADGFKFLEPLPMARRALWESGAGISIARSSPWIYLIPRPVRWDIPHEKTQPGPVIARQLVWRGMPVYRPLAQRLPWGTGRPPAFVWPPPVSPEPPVPEPVEPYHGDPNLHLECLLTAWGGYVPLYIPTVCTRRRRTWIVINEIVLRRLSDSAVIPCVSINVSSDIDSWAWGLSADVPLASSISLIHPGAGPVEVETVINGWTWRGMVEGYTEKRLHGQRVYAVSGRSRSALLASPYSTPRAYILNEDRTAQQLAELEVEGTGWSVDWDTVNWLIPAGAWAYNSETPMSALVKIAASVGAVIQTDPSGMLVRVVPRYAVSPWDWAAATPDKIAPEDIVYETSSKWEARTLYQGVYVSGVNQGVLCRAYRSGTSGAPYDAMITDGLITHVDAGRERGRNQLARAGKWEIVGADLPVVASGPGVVTPGTLLRIDAPVPWIGQVISCKISAAPAYVRQSIEIERYRE